MPSSVNATGPVRSPSPLSPAAPAGSWRRPKSALPILLAQSLKQPRHLPACPVPAAPGPLVQHDVELGELRIILRQPLVECRRLLGCFNLSRSRAAASRASACCLLAGCWSITSPYIARAGSFCPSCSRIRPRHQGGFGGDRLGGILLQQFVERGGGLGQFAGLELAPAETQLSFHLVFRRIAGGRQPAGKLGRPCGVVGVVGRLGKISVVGTISGCCGCFSTTRRKACLALSIWRVRAEQMASSPIALPGLAAGLAGRETSRAGPTARHIF